MFKDELIVLLTAALPISELRGAIPLAILKFNFPLWKAFLISVTGNLLPVIPLILFLGLFEKFSEKIPFLNKIFNFFKIRALKRKKIIEKYEILGIYLFVAIPLPFTGAWTGCLLAYLFMTPPFPTFLAVLSGILTAGVIVSTILLVGIKWGILAGVLFGGLLLLILNFLVR